MPKVSVIMPVYAVEMFVADAVRSVLEQSYTDFELIIVDDCSPDNSITICRSFNDPRLRIVRHPQNRGLAAARNTGIRHATGAYLAFLDSDDLWCQNKLERHVAHLDEKPEVGVSFSRSAFINADGSPMHYHQMPRLSDISPAYLLCRNPVGNGSAPVIRREVFEDIRTECRFDSDIRDCYFDEHFRQSEDIECWSRIALTTKWRFEGLPEALTMYRLNAGGLSAKLLEQLASWEQMIRKIRAYAPQILHDKEDLARAYQLRYLARQAIRLQDGAMAVSLMHRALLTRARIFVEEPGRTLITLGAAYALSILPRPLYSGLENIARGFMQRMQKRRIMRDLQRFAM